MTDEHRIALGKITHEYMLLDGNVSWFIWRLIAMDQRIGQTITSGLTFSNRVALLRALFGMLPALGIATDMEGFGKTLTQVELAATKRNRVVHALAFLATGTDGELEQINQKRWTAEWTGAPASVQDLLRTADELKAAADALSGVMHNHFVRPYDLSEVASPLGPGTLWGVAVKLGISWLRAEGIK